MRARREPWLAGPAATEPVVLRPLRVRDGDAWRDMRGAERGLAAAVGGDQARRRTGAEIGFAPWSAGCGARRATGRTLPFAVDVPRPVRRAADRSAAITWGSLCAAHIGYWVDQAHAGRGIMPTARRAGRRPLLRHRGAAPGRGQASGRRTATAAGWWRSSASARRACARRYLHIDGAWRDHLCYALTAEEVPGGVLPRWRSALAAARSGATAESARFVRRAQHAWAIGRADLARQARPAGLCRAAAARRARQLARRGMSEPKRAQNGRRRRDGGAAMRGAG